MQKICPKVLKGKEQKSLMMKKEWKMKDKMKIVIGNFNILFNLIFVIFISFFIGVSMISKLGKV